MENNDYYNPYIVCVNCGAMISKDDAQCPFCDAMQYEASNKKYMRRLYGMNNKMKGLDNAANVSTGMNTMIICAITVALIILTSIGCFATAIFRHKLTNGTDSDNKKVQEELAWYDENYETINKCYEQQDFEGISDIVYVKNSYSTLEIFRSWEHYEVFYIYDTSYKYFMNYYKDMQDNKVYKKYAYEYAITHLYNMNVFTNYNMNIYYSSSLSEEDAAIVDGWTENVLEFMHKQLDMSDEKIAEEIRYIYSEPFEQYERLREMSERYEVQ